MYTYGHPTMYSCVLRGGCADCILSHPQFADSATGKLTLCLHTSRNFLKICCSVCWSNKSATLQKEWRKAKVILSTRSEKKSQQNDGNKKTDEKFPTPVLQLQIPNIFTINYSDLKRDLTFTLTIIVQVPSGPQWNEKHLPFPLLNPKSLLHGTLNVCHYTPLLQCITKMKNLQLANKRAENIYKNKDLICSLNS